MGLPEFTGGSTLVVLVTSAGDPAFDIDHVGILHSKVASAALKKSIGQFEQLQQFLDQQRVEPSSQCR